MVIQIGYIRPNVPVHLIRGFFNFRFSSRKSQSQRKLAKKITHFTIQLRSKNVIYFTNLNSLDIENNMSPNTAKTPSDPFFINLPENMFLSGVRNNICTALFLDVEDAVSGCQETVQCNTFSETETRFLEANVCIFLYISAGKFLFQRRSKILPGKLRVG